MYLPSNINTGRNTNGTPLKYTVRARDAIHQTLFNNNTNNNLGEQQQQQQQQFPLPSNSVTSTSSISQQQQRPSVLKYGSSPLANSINASQLSTTSTNNNNTSNNDQSSVTSNTSTDQEDSAQQPTKKKKKLFGFNLKKYRSNESLLHRTTTQDSTNSSILSEAPSSQFTTEQQSLFTQPLTLQTTISTYNTDLQAQQAAPQQLEINLEDALPTDFKDFYSPDSLIDTLPNGRPKFTQRDIIDWQLNDIRSLLIMSELKKEWQGIIPIIRPVNNNNIFFKIQFIPLTASDEEIVNTLIDSDIYKETNFHLNFKIKTATYIVNTVRQKHLQMLKQYYQISNDDSTHDQVLSATPLLKYELRNIIENYLLNLGVESQCRSNFKKNCLILKKQKWQLFNLNEDFDKNKNLLKTALINNSNSLLNLPNIDKNSIKLSRFEKAKIWNQVQVEVYAKLNLDWQPDNIG